MTRTLFLSSCSLGLAIAQQAGQQKPEGHPHLSIQQCNGGSNCWDEEASIVLDAQRRWLHDSTTPEAYENCIKDEGEAASWDPKLCPDALTCAKNCAYDGVSEADYADKYGISPVDRGVQLAFEKGSNVGAQVYVLENEQTYKMFKLKNKEISFDVNLASLPCGTNAAFYLVAMNPTGQKGVGGNDAGAKFGTGYCDAQCPHRQKFVQGEANMQDWNGADESGHFGSCCTEIDLWEGNSQAAAFTAHPCTGEQTRCEGAQCGDTEKGEHYLGVCDKDGCDFNTYRLGVKDFYGPGKRVDTMQPFTVVTQFLTADGTDGGALTEIKQFYIQGGKVIEPPKSEQQGVAGDSMSDGYCSNLKQTFINTRAKNNPQGDFDQFTAKGGLGSVGNALDGGMVLVMSLWDDPASGMRWLDSNAPSVLPESVPGVVRGPCPMDQGDAAAVEAANPGASVTYSNIRYGEIGSTSNAGLPGARAAAPEGQPAPYTPPVTAPDMSGAATYGQGVGTAQGVGTGYGQGVIPAYEQPAPVIPAYGQPAYGQPAPAYGQYGQPAPVAAAGCKDAIQNVPEVGLAARPLSMYAFAVIAVSLLAAASALAVTGRRATRPRSEFEAELCLNDSEETQSRPVE